jgi:hypothetical protein
MAELSYDELRELLVKCWMTHDGTWFMSVAGEFGIDAANRLNKSAIRTLAPIELRRVTKAMGVKGEALETFEELKAVVDAMFATIKGDFMDFTFDYPEENMLHWKMGRCFALEGMKMIGAYEDYDCGVLYRVTCWLDAMGVEYEADPTPAGCLQRDTGRCEGSIRFSFGGGHES